MKTLLTLLALLVVVATLTLAQSNNDEAPIRQRLRLWDDAYKTRNVQALGELLADNFTMTDASGARLTKAEYLMSVVKSPDIAREISYASEDVIVKIDGANATVTGRSAVKGRGRGRVPVFAGAYRFTDTWVKVKGVWKPLETRATRVAG